MKQKSRWISGALVMVGTLLGAEAAEAQSQPATSAAATATAGAQALGNPREDDIEDEGKKNPMAWAGIGVKLGMTGTTEGKAEVQGYESETAGRVGLQVSVPINLGGDGFGFVLEPLLTKTAVDRVTKDSAGVPNGTESVSLLGLGGYIGPTFNIHVIDPLYLGFGFGLKGTYMLNDAFDLAAEVYGRVPVNATYYLNKQVALVGEVGFGYGASVFADKPSVVIDPITMTAMNTETDPTFGMAFVWDASVGARFP